MADKTKFLLDEQRLPARWYNTRVRVVSAQHKLKYAPLLGSAAWYRSGEFCTQTRPGGFDRRA
jgi:hypothetical protein